MRRIIMRQSLPITAAILLNCRQAYAQTAMNLPRHLHPVAAASLRSVSL